MRALMTSVPELRDEIVKLKAGFTRRLWILGICTPVLTVTLIKLLP